MLILFESLEWFIDMIYIDKHFLSLWKKTEINETQIDVVDIQILFFFLTMRVNICLSLFICHEILS